MNQEIMLIKEHTRGTGETMHNAESFYKEMQDLKDSTKEHFIVFYLDSNNKIIMREIVSIGTLNTCLISPTIIFRNAIIRNCNSIVIAHNHPSGDVEPSYEDINITKLLIRAGKILQIKLLDHIIIGNDTYKSIINLV